MISKRWILLILVIIITLVIISVLGVFDLVTFNIGNSISDSGSGNVMPGYIP